MVPAEKARDLVHRFYISLPNNGGFTGLNNIHSRWKEGKMCASMAVDVTIDTLNHDIRDLDVRGSILLDLIKYWREVKEEIEKIKD